MGDFNFNSFVDLTAVFAARKGKPAASRARIAWQPIQDVSVLPQSSFIDISAFTAAPSKFLPAKLYDHALQQAFNARIAMAANDNAQVFQSRFIERIFKDDLLIIQFNICAEMKSFTPAAQIIDNMPSLQSLFEKAAEEAPKPRGTLKLKTKIEVLPPAPGSVMISRRSSIADLAIAFKTEMAQLEKKAQVKMPVTDEASEKRRHPLSNKSWAELLAEAELAEVKKPKRDIDLANAFRNEMRAFEAEQQKVSQAAEPIPFRPRPREKNRILAA
jgi:hypothetical protein